MLRKSLNVRQKCTRRNSDEKDTGLLSQIVKDILDASKGE
jgi:hypothetical protein